MKIIPIVIPFILNRKQALYEQRNKSPQFVHLVNHHSDIDILSILRFSLYRFQTVLFTNEDIYIIILKKNKQTISSVHP